MTLRELAELYVRSHVVCQATAAIYVREAERLSEALGTGDVEALTTQSIGEASRVLTERYGERRAHECLRRVRTLIRFGVAAELVDREPRQWPRVRTTLRAPEAWTPDQVRRLVRIARAQPGRIGGVPAGLWWQAWMHLQWETAMRASEMLALRWADVDLETPAVLIRGCRKRVSSQWVLIRRETAELLARLMRDSRPEDPVFRVGLERRELYTVFRYLCVLAGIPTPRGHTQLTHRLRRSAISAAAMQSLEAARRLAGHTRPETTVRHYVDYRIIAAPPPVPPLGGRVDDRIRASGAAMGSRSHRRRQAHGRGYLQGTTAARGNGAVAPR